MKVYHDECNSKHEAVAVEGNVVRFNCFGVVYEAENKSGWVEVGTSKAVYQVQ